MSEPLSSSAPSLSPRAVPLPYQPDFEKPEDDETATAAALVETLLKISDITYKDSGLGLRSVHAAR
jgi:hypothetical protein